MQAISVSEARQNFKKYCNAVVEKNRLVYDFDNNGNVVISCKDHYEN